MNCSNLHLLWKKKIVSLLYKFLEECLKFGPHFVAVLKIVHRSPRSDDKVIYMNLLLCLQV